MSELQEQQAGEASRTMARDYAEGRFNKQEYRQRRRALIADFTGKPMHANATDPVGEAETGAVLSPLGLLGGLLLAMSLMLGILFFF
jgi:hypothetical protein